jgi:hypothetical protein
MLETWNLARDPRGAVATLRAQLAALVPQFAADDEVIVTHAFLTDDECIQLGGAQIRFLRVPATAGFYDHKNRGFASSCGDIVCFLDGDTAPCPTWLAELTGPIARGEALVTGGFTGYPGPLAELGNLFDFPHFHAGRGSPPAGSSAEWRCGSIDDAAQTVRHFWANNVAFARAVFTAHPFPVITPMFHGQCQVLALQLREAGIAILGTPRARVSHGWPVSALDWLHVRLLRGADTRSLLPYIAEAHVPRATRTVRSLGPLPALSLLGVRAAVGTVMALRRGPRLRSLALVAGCTLVDSVGAAAAPIVYRALA